MTIALKQLSPKAREASAGAVNLKSKEGSVVKKALLCREGTFDGMFGSVTVTKEMLEHMASNYNEQRKVVQNENDYAPILLDHTRMVDLVKGRLLAGLEVAPWMNPETGVEITGLYGDLRIDDEDAQQKVDKGLYAHLSISFDEESLEIFEVSFVAVEAARRSIVLKKGETMELSKKLATLSQKHKALAAHVAEARKKRKATLAKLVAAKADLETQIKELTKQANAVALTVKVGQVKGKFAAFVKGGKMNPVELKEMDFKALAALPDAALAIVLKSYEARSVSTDVFQYGQDGRNEIKDAAMSPEKMRAAIKLQREGKGAALAFPEDADRDKDKQQDKDKQDMAEGDPAKADGDKDKEKEAKSYAMSEDDYKHCMEEMSGMSSKLGALIEKIKGLGAEADEMAAGDDKDEEKEKELAADEEPEKKDDKKEGEQ